ncbi:MAG: 50S ribosomal protein L18 [Verrucomicrobia bacterium]|jgi:large subunit ribosomal protein L18|nr:50S ribosomal protein L18 [Verrucomicrobiota bacterium]
MKAKTRKDYRASRHQRIRKKISGTAACPRMAVMVSNKHMYVQLIDDDTGCTLASASSVKDADNNLDAATQVGKRAGEAAKEKGVSQFVVDRGGFRYHGRVKAVVEGAIEAGLRNTKEAK